MAQLIIPCKTALLFYPHCLTQNTRTHWRQEIKREILLSQGQKGVSSSLRENGRTKGKVSWFGWVSPEQRLVSGKDGFCRETPEAQQVHMWLPLCPMAEAGGSAAAVTPVLALTTAPAPGTGTGAAGQQWGIPAPLLSLDCYFPSSLCSRCSFWRASFLDTLCLHHLCILHPKMPVHSQAFLQDTVNKASKQADWDQNKRTFLPLISSWDYLLLLKIQTNLCLLWGCV